MATMALQGIYNKTRIQGGQAAFNKKGTRRYQNLGAVPTAEFQPNITELDALSQEAGPRQLIGVYNVQRDGTINLTLESYTELAFEAAFMSEKKYLTQAASTDILTFDDIEEDYAFKISGINPEVVSFTNGDSENPIELVEDTHYTVHQTGIVQVISLPVGFGKNAEVSYSLPSITEADKKLDLGVMSKSGIRGELVIIGTSDETGGATVEWTFWDVELRPSGAISAFNTESINQIQLTGRVFTVAGKGPGKSYGQMRSLSAI